MTAYRFVTLTCDGCGEISDAGTAQTVREAGRFARSKGWKHDERGDTCPVHNGWRRDGMGGYVRVRDGEPA